MPIELDYRNPARQPRRIWLAPWLQGIGLALIPLGPAFALAGLGLMQDSYNSNNSYRPPMYVHFVLQVLIYQPILSVPLGVGLIWLGRRLMRR